MEEENNIIVKWAQEDVETSYNLLNRLYMYMYIGVYTCVYIYVYITARQRDLVES